MFFCLSSHSLYGKNTFNAIFVQLLVRLSRAELAITLAKNNVIQFLGEIQKKFVNTEYLLAFVLDYLHSFL